MCANYISGCMLALSAHRPTNRPATAMLTVMGNPLVALDPVMDTRNNEGGLEGMVSDNA